VAISFQGRTMVSGIDSQIEDSTGSLEGPLVIIWSPSPLEAQWNGTLFCCLVTE
jgi:hypothetical protein